MIDKNEVRVGKCYAYPHPDGVGMVNTLVVRITRPTAEYPEGRVQHESVQIGRGALDSMEVFCANAVKTPEPR